MAVGILLAGQTGIARVNNPGGFCRWEAIGDEIIVETRL